MRVEYPDMIFPGMRPLAVVLALGAGAPALACPDWQQTGQQIRYSADQLWTPQSLSVVAGGASNLANCAAPGVGYVAARPDFDLTLTDNASRRDLVIRVTASCDAVLLVNGADGQWSFNDDSDGFNPRLQLPAARAGVYDIWVGTYSPTPCQATLTLETMRGTQMPQSQYPSGAVCPHPGRNGDLLSYDAGQLVRAQRFDVIAGGDTDLGACSSVPGHGHIIQSPDFTLNLTGNAQGHDLQLRAEAGCDPVLLVNGPDGQWHFNDDADGLNSRLRLPRAQTGSYDIWVGTFGSQNCHATLIAEALGGQPAPQPQPQPVVPQPSGTTGGGLTWRFDRDAQGWQVRDGQLSNVPGSHMQITAWGDSRVGYLIAPPSALGDWRGVTAIDAVMRSPGSRYFAAFSEGAVGDLVLYNGTMSAAAAFPHWLGPDWAHLSVPLRQAVTLGGTLRWQLGGGAGSLEQVLANVTAFHVRGEFRLGDTIADVREIALQGVIGPSPIAMPQPQTQPQPVAGLPAVAGVWRIDGNNFAGTLTLTWSGAGWTGVVNYDVYRRDEPLENIRFDPANGSIEFTRPISGATQIYRGRLTGGEMRGEFNQAGGAYSYVWSATLSAPQAGGGTAPATGGASK